MDPKYLSYAIHKVDYLQYLQGHPLSIIMFLPILACLGGSPSYRNRMLLQFLLKKQAPLRWSGYNVTKLFQCWRCKLCLVSILISSKGDWWETRKRYEKGKITKPTKSPSRMHLQLFPLHGHTNHNMQMSVVSTQTSIVAQVPQLQLATWGKGKHISD